jgi:carbon storage regulator
MLVLSRKIGEVITIGNSVTVTVLSFDRGIVRVGIEAPKSVAVHRKEVYDKIIDMNKAAAQTDVSALKNVLGSLALNGAGRNLADDAELLNGSGGSTIIPSELVTVGKNGVHRNGSSYQND